MKKRILALILCLCLLIGITEARAETSELGDANGDGKVTSADAALILRHLVHLSQMSAQEIQNVDLNGNGAADASDAAAILRYVAHIAPLSVNTTQKPDETLLKKVRKGLKSDLANMAESIALFIQQLPESNPHRAIFIQALNYMGRSYDSMDCSTFIRETYRACGYSADVYPGRGSDYVLRWFRENHADDLHRVFYFEESGQPDTRLWTPGVILFYTDSDDTANHVAIYVGEIDGRHIIMESAGSLNGVGICELWSASNGFRLSYYADTTSLMLG